MIAAIVVAGVAGFVLTRPILHLRGDYLAIVTIAFGEIVRMLLVNNVGGITGGANGLFGIDQPSIFGFTFHTTLSHYYLVLFFVVITIIAMRRLENSRLGRAWTYVREDEVAAEAMGVDTVRVKAIAFLLGSAWAGLAGALYASRITVISPDMSTLPGIGHHLLHRRAGRHRLDPRRVRRHGRHGDPAGAVPLRQGLARWVRRPGHGADDDLPPDGPVAEPARGDRDGRGRRRASCPGCVGESMSLLEVQSLSRSFGGLMAVSNVDLYIETGEILGMIGPNGAGKTTVFNLITGIYQPDQGTIVFEGNSLVGKRPHAIAGRASPAPSRPSGSSPHLTVMENVMSGRDCRSNAGRCRRDLPSAVAAREEQDIRPKAEAPHALHERLAVSQ